MAAPTKTKPSVVFAHGIWADGSSFSKVIPLLQAAGYECISTQNSLDVAAVQRALGRVSSPAILVGHSYGGQVISAAGTDDRVGLVYIAALAPDRVWLEPPKVIYGSQPSAHSLFLHYAF